MPCPSSHICHWVVSWDISVPKEIFCQLGTMGQVARWNVLTLSRKFYSGFKVNPTSKVKNGDMCFPRRKLENKQGYITTRVYYHNGKPVWNFSRTHSQCDWGGRTMAEGRNWKDAESISTTQESFLTPRAVHTCNVFLGEGPRVLGWIFPCDSIDRFMLP